MAPKESDVPQPGPARLSKGAGPDEWLEQAKTCKYLPEADMKRLCEIVKECLMEGRLSRNDHAQWQWRSGAYHTDVPISLCLSCTVTYPTSH
jgi:hypothetical protein